MRKIKEIMRLRLECGYSHRIIAQSVGVSSSTVSDCLSRVQKANLSWPLQDDISDEQLEARLYSLSQESTGETTRKEIDWPYIHRELKRKHVTLMLLWNEYKGENSQGISYSQFCYLYRQWRQQLDVWMRQPHKAGEKLFVDYAGQTVPVVIDNSTGEIRDAQIFVATLGASNFTYTQATWTQTLPDWIQSHINAFEFMQGCPAIVVPDNLKSGVHKSHLYEPDINPTYQDLAVHYGVAIIPARASTPKDKAKVENGVQQVERQILAKLRNRIFFSLAELNQALSLLLDELNRRPFQKLAGSRLSQFEEIDRPALKPLPVTKYEYAEWKKVKAGLNYHVQLNKHHYSVPYTFVKKPLHVRYNSKTVEVFYKNKRIASHVRQYTSHRYTTDSSHMPKNHQHQVKWTPERIASWAGKMGPSTIELVEKIMSERDHPQQGFRSCIGIINLAKSYGNQRLEAACLRALSIGAHSYKSVESILKNNLDQSPLPTDLVASNEAIPNCHEYVRGQHYFQ